MTTTRTPLTLATVAALIAEGFTTQAAKKAAGEKLNTLWGAITFALPQPICWGLPQYPHQISAKTLAALAEYPETQEQARQIKALRAEFKAAEVKPAAVEIDDTKVRELAPADATREGLVFVDSQGEARGYCYCCGRVGFKLNRAGCLSRHGYTRPGWGYDLGGCSGYGHTPQETLFIAIDCTAAHVAKVSALLATDLFAFAITEGRKAGAVRRAKIRQGLARTEGKGGWARSSRASAFSLLRAGHDCGAGVVGVASWRRTLSADLAGAQGTLAALLAVAEGLEE